MRESFLRSGRLSAAAFVRPGRWPCCTCVTIGHFHTWRPADGAGPLHGEPAERPGLAEEGTGTLRIQAVDRAVALLKSVADATTPPTALELAQACGINRSTA